MTSYVIEPDELSKLKGKTILIVGAASGIGHAAVEIALGACCDTEIGIKSD
jgi:NADPH:quinone reductase-like Zn-dependent oxidoreductase